MADATSSLKVEVDDTAFTKFARAFKQHYYEVGKASSEWNKLQQSLRKTNNVMGQFVLAQHMWSQMQAKYGAQVAAQVNNVKNATTQATNQTSHLGLAWGGLARTTGTVASNVFNILRTILRWSAIGTGIGGLLGVGGFFGLRGLGRDVSQGRRASLGLGLSYGQRQAFGVNYGRLVDSEGFLGGVNEALSDVTKRYSLYAAGLGEGDLASGDTGKISIQLLQRLKELADHTPRNLLGQAVTSRGLGQFGIGVQEMLRLKNTSQAELSGYASRYATDTGAMALTEDTQKRWQDFYVQLNRAGANLENVLVRGLEKLTPSLEKLSVEFVNFLKGFTDSPHFQEWIDSFSKGVEDFAKYIGSNEFRNNVSTFAEDIGALAHSVHNALKWLGIVSTPKTYEGMSSKDARVDRILHPEKYGKEFNLPFISPETQATFGKGFSENFNVGNIKNAGGVGFRKYGSLNEGVSAISNLLLHGKYFKGKDTLRGIEETYSPRSDNNDTERLIRELSKGTGFAPDKRLNLNDPNVMAAIVSGITKQEGVRPLGKEVVIKILNQTGGSATVSVAAAAGGG